MEQLIIREPTLVEIPASVNEASLKDLLTYTDQKVVFEYRKAKKSFFLKKKLGDDYDAYIADLKAAQKKSLLLDEHFTYSGLSQLLSTKFGLPVKNEVQYPDPKYIGGMFKQVKTPRPYQEVATEKLLQVRHGSVQMGTGLGKSYIILQLAKKLGMKTIIMTPSVSIAGQIYDEFSAFFGKKYVGAFYDGKKESKKLFVIGVAASLTKVDPKGPIWQDLSTAKVFIADESHMCPAVTLAKVCMGVARYAPYRFFFSGTQLRSDGLDLMLQGIIGPIVYEMTVRQGVDQGWLSKPLFKMLEVESDNTFTSSDMNDMTRQHLFYNPKVNRAAASIANNAVKKLGHGVLILVEEMEQFSHLLPYLTVEAGFAHGGVTKDNASKVPKEYHKSDPKALVERFNAKQLPVLIGTSCIATGTDIRENKTSIYLMGGKSEIQVRQAVGRDTRLTDSKKECHHFDFDVTNVPDLHRHAIDREDIYNDIYGPVKRLKI